MLPTEAELITWLGVHWPSLVLAGILTRAYLKIRGFVWRLERLEKRSYRHRSACAEVHEKLPGHGARIFDDGENGTPE